MRVKTKQPENETVSIQPPELNHDLLEFLLTDVVGRSCRAWVDRPGFLCRGSMFRFESCEFFCEGRSCSECRTVSEEDKWSDTKECADTCRESSCALYAERIVHIGGEKREDGLSRSGKWSATVTTTTQRDIRLTPTTLRTNDMAERAEEASRVSKKRN